MDTISFPTAASAAAATAVSRVNTHSLAISEFPAEWHVLSQGKPNSGQEHARAADCCPQLAGALWMLTGPSIRGETES